MESEVVDTAHWAASGITDVNLATSGLLSTVEAAKGSGHYKYSSQSTV